MRLREIWRQLNAPQDNSIDIASETWYTVPPRFRSAADAVLERRHPFTPPLQALREAIDRQELPAGSVILLGTTRTLPKHRAG